MARAVAVGPADEGRTAALRMAAGRRGVELDEVAVPTPDAAPLTDPARLERWAAEIAGARGSDDPGSDRIEAVVAAGPEVSLAAACLARALGLQHHPPASVAVTLDRSCTRQAFFRHGVPHPEFRVLRPGDDVAHLARLVGIPCAVMPCVALGRVAGLRAVDDEEAVGALHVSRSILRRRGLDDVDLVVERCVKGLEIVVVGWVRAGAFETLLVFDKPDNVQHPHHGDELLVAPTGLAAGQRGEAARVCSTVVGAIGLTDGPVSIDLCVDDRLVRVLELRSSWPQSLHGVEIADETLIEEVELACAMGAAPPPTLTGTLVVLDVVAPQDGTLESIGGTKEALGAESVRAVTPLEAGGALVAAPPESDRPVARVVSRADMRNVAVDAVRAARDRLAIVIRA